MYNTQNFKADWNGLPYLNLIYELYILILCSSFSACSIFILKFWCYHTKLCSIYTAAVIASLHWYLRIWKIVI